MPGKNVGTLIVGGGQAGLAMSAHLIRRGAPHVVLERRRIAERWRTERWDSLVANGPAWHDRFPAKTFSDVGADDFASKDSVAAYFERFAAEIGAPVRCGVEVRAVRRARRGGRFEVDTSDGPLEADNVVAATGPFQRPVIPAAAEGAPGLRQMHSSAYRNPDQLADGAVLVVGAGSSGAQIADELLRADGEVDAASRPQ
ncbi:MAG: NAD(P)/FAD-dependent oxidoreductase, partial [Pseudomonadota bacterium]